MKVTIEGQANFHHELGVADDESDVPIEVIGPPDEDLEGGQILISHPRVSLILSAPELRRALRVFE